MISQCEAGHESHQTRVVDTRLGAMTIYDFAQYMGFKGYCPGQDDVSRTLDLYGVWERPESNLVLDILTRGHHGVFIDAGAHIGWYSRLATQKGYEVWGYEGDLCNAELFRTNNPGVPITPVWFDENLGECGAGDGRIEMIKMDLEGAEQYALRYFAPILPQTHNLLVEVSPVFNDSYPALIDQLVKDGFSVFTVDREPFDFKYDFPQTNLWFTRGE